MVLASDYSNAAHPNLPKEVTDLFPADANRYTSGTNVDATTQQNKQILKAHGLSKAM